MGQFLRIAALVLLILIGFGTGICGLLGLGAVFADLFGALPSASDRGLILGLSALFIAITVGCFFGIRALARRMREAARKDTH